MISDPIKEAQAFFIRGQVHEKKNNMVNAIEDFKRALQINPSLISAAFAKAACENRLGNFEEAIDSYNEAFAIEQKN